ncbi:MAG: SRPBCC domain-containing protein [Pseudomonadota bacterium]
MTADFGTLTFTRDITGTAERLFELMTRPEHRSVWSGPTETAKFVIKESDVRAGGYELATCGPDPQFDARTDFHVVDAPTTLICTETIFVEGETICVSLATQEITPHDDKVTLKVTVQVASLCGPEMVSDYKDGWGTAIDKLANLASVPTPA